jgi:hypothetical protein
MIGGVNVVRLVTALALAGAACQLARTPTEPARDSPVPNATRTAPAQVPSAPPSFGQAATGQIAHRLAEQQILRAIEVRAKWGLRSDEAWVRAVAADPAADMHWRLPLTASERAELGRRPANSHDVAIFLDAYGAGFPLQYGGYRIAGLPRQRTITALFTGDLVEHEARLRSEIRPDVHLVLERVRWPLKELEDLHEAVIARASWLKTVRARLVYAGVVVDENILELDISSANPDAPRAIVRHFNAQKKLRVVSDGTGAALMPTGHLRGQAIDRRGRPVVDLGVKVVGDIKGASDGGEIGHGTGDRGEFSFEDLTAVGYTVYLERYLGDAGWKTVGKGHVTIRANRTAYITILVDEA